MIHSRMLLQVTSVAFLMGLVGCKRSETIDTEAPPTPVATEAADSRVATASGTDAKPKEETGAAPSTPSLVAEQPTSGAPFVLTDMSKIKVPEGMPSPKLGDTIYTMEILPRTACGEYWVVDSQGHVAKLAVCTHGEGHH